jgi:hypothetical protein
MDKEVFDGLAMPCQNAKEWRWFLCFCESYFSARGIEHPMVVEIGLDKNAQKAFYENLLGATHIGIDNNPEVSGTDILADSHDPKTVELLKEKLGGKLIDLLYIDGDHYYEGVKRDYELFSPLAPRLIAFHDVAILPSIRKFWEELIADYSANENRLFVSFHNHHSGYLLNKWPFGIGLMVCDP